MAQDISGDISNTRVPEIVKILSLGRRTGRLYVTNGAETGNIFFSDGRVVHARCSSLTGIKAIQEASVWSSGEYRFFVDEQADMQTVIMDMEEILSEVTNHLRQMDKVTSLIPSPAAVYCLETNIREKEVHVKAAQWKVLSLVDGRKSIADIARLTSLAVTDAMKIFYMLLKMGLVREAFQDVGPSAGEPLELPKTEFMEALKAALTRAIGPMAPFVIQETASELSADLLSEDTAHRALMVESIADKIPHQGMSLAFLEAMTDHLREGV
jgi:hypothetical protein